MKSMNFGKDIYKVDVSVMNDIKVACSFLDKKLRKVGIDAEEYYRIKDKKK